MGAHAVAEKVLTALEQPFRIEGQRFYISGSIGISLYPQHADDAGALLQRADVAMYLAKGSDIGYAVYEAMRDEYSPSKLALYGQLRQAIDSNQLVLNYQPKADMRTGRVQSAEVLVRWQHPEQGMIFPDDFIPLAEHTGLIKPLTTWVLNEALRQHRTWRNDGMDIALAVNISARTLHDSRLVTTIADSLALSSVVPSRVVIEITESALMLDPDRALEILTHLHDLGVRIAIDDFGTGYSSLAYLKRLPADEIKIDRSFVTSLASDDDDAVIVRSIIQLAHNLGLTTVAEGVEDAESWAMLTEMGCDAVQGYYLSRPLSSEDCGAWLAKLLDRVAS
jgi:EAL domain-containing protein (putative c-di-GMP-specific phosphodiesterase class I)